MKLACSSASYDAAFKAGRLDLREWLRLCAEMDLDGVEFLDVHFQTTDRAYLRELKKLCIDLQLTIAAIAVTDGFGDDEARAAQIERVRGWCDIAAFMGAPIVRVPPGRLAERSPEPDQGRIIGMFRKVFGQRPPNVRLVWSDTMSALRSCADHAAERAIVIALENARGEHSLITTPHDIARCVRDVGSPWLRICLEPAGLTDAAGVDAALQYVVHVRAIVQEVRDDGSDPRAHWPELLRMLKFGPYRGFVTIQYESPLEDPETAVPRAARYLRGLLRLLERQRLLVSASAGSGNGMVDQADIADVQESEPARTTPAT